MLSIFTLQVFMVLFQWINFVSRKTDKTRFRFFLIALAYLVFSITWVSLLKTFTFSTWKEIPTLGYLAISMIGFTYFYISKECGFKHSKKTALELAITLASVYCIYQISIVSFGSEFIYYETFGLLIMLQFIALYFAQKIVRPIIKMKLSGQDINPILIVGLIVACIYSFLPLLFTLVNDYYIEFTLINSPFIVISLTYLARHIQQQKSESNLLTQDLIKDTLVEYSQSSKKNVESLGLTERQKEIAIMLIQEKSYKEISDKLFITEASVRKHASNIFKKSRVNSLLEFKESYDFSSEPDQS